MNYSPELKEAILRRMLPPNNESIIKIAQQEGISEQTLRNWRNEARRNGKAAPATDAPAEKWSTQDKFLIVMETCSYCQKKPMRSGGIQRAKNKHLRSQQSHHAYRGSNPKPRQP